LKKKILVTGGLGFIGSHTSLKLLQKDYEIIILDNLSNSKIEVKNVISSLTNKDFEFIEGDIRNKNLLRKIFEKNHIDFVIHFAGLKSVINSGKLPLEYYENNVLGSLILFQEMKFAGIKSLVFSSSASVYGNSKLKKCSENAPLDPVSVYGKTKLIIENILKDLYSSDSSWKIINLRYFNPIGAHPSGLLCEDPNLEATNLIPLITKVAQGKSEELLIFGGDYNTSDGTGKRDYIHVEDLANGHIAALEKMQLQTSLCIDVNLGTGVSYSVLDVIKTFEKVSKRKIPYRITNRREGDIDELCADPEYANNILNWRAQYDLEKMCLDSWNCKGITD
jgi:UDP-glucose 4-epimerase